MCLLFFALESHPEYPLIVAANRDEYYERPTQNLHVWQDDGQIVAGRDLDKGGTWFGVTLSGRWAGVTNFRESTTMPDARSRGALVSTYLSSQQKPESYIAEVAQNAEEYNGFNLIVGDQEQVFYYSNRTPDIRHLRRGMYGLSNHLLDTPWPKVKSGKTRLQLLLDHDDMSVDALFLLLAARSIAPDEALPDTGIAVEWERLLSSAFISGEGYGTRSSTVLLINRNNRLKLEERTFLGAATQTPGHYSSTTYEFNIQ